MRRKTVITLLVVFIFFNLAFPCEVMAITLGEVIKKDSLRKLKESKIEETLDEGNLIVEEKYDDLQESYNYFQDIEQEYYDYFIDKNNEEIDKDIQDSFLEDNDELEKKDNSFDFQEENEIYIENEENIEEEVLIDEVEDILWDKTKENYCFEIKNDEFEENNIVEYENIESKNNNEDEIGNNINNKDDGISLSAFYEEAEAERAKDNGLNYKDKGLDNNRNSRSISNNKGTETIDKTREDLLKLSDLEITKDDKENLKIKFKIDNDLDLKNTEHDLKVYIANDITKSKDVIISKDKSEEKYLALDGVTDLSGKNIALGKNDYLSKGSYTVTFSDDEMERLKNIGLENLIVKVEADFNGKSNTLIGSLKKEKNLENTDNEEVEENEEIQKTLGKNINNTKEEVLPKTGVLINNILIIFAGVLFVLLGVLVLKKRKIEI